MYILGISAFYHDSACALISDGEIIAAAQEERFSRKKHDFAFPKNALAYCLKQASISINQVDYLAFYEKPFIKFERILDTYFAFAPLGFTSFAKAIPLWLKQRLFIGEEIRKQTGFKGKILYPEHHQSHAASAFYPSPFRDAVILTVDGVGEWTSASIGTGEENKIKILQELKFPHSLGLLYAAFTYYTGFKVNSAEYKVMGLAPYGEPKYADLILEKLVDLKPDGSFKLNQKYFNYCVGLKMTNRRFHQLFGQAPRKPETRLTQREMDLAASVQKVTEEIMLKMVRYARERTGKKNLCLAGGVALNCVANGRILREGPFENLWIQPAASDAGAALGAALFSFYEYLDKERHSDGKNDIQKGSLLGPSFSQEEIERFLKGHEIFYEKLEEKEIPVRIARLIAEENVVGWFYGRMEFGPRALGARSILADARSAKMQKILNLKIKFRESFRPFAASILRERVADYFEMDTDSPYMLLVAPVVKMRRRKMTESERDLFGIEKLNVVRSDIPAVTHVDYSCRVQTVSAERHPLFYDLLKAFEAITGCGLIINTSFNVRGEPIVCTPQEAYTCFMRTEMDWLLLGNFLLDKKKQKPLTGESDWKKQFELD
jgi:carbamoyltransferase